MRMHPIRLIIWSNKPHQLSCCLFTSSRGLSENVYNYLYIQEHICIPWSCGELSTIYFVKMAVLLKSLIFVENGKNKFTHSTIGV